MFEKYGKHDGTMDYRTFCDNCTKIERELERMPLKQIGDEDMILNTRRNPLSLEVLSTLKRIDDNSMGVGFGHIHDAESKLPVYHVDINV